MEVLKVLALVLASTGIILALIAGILLWEQWKSLKRYVILNIMKERLKKHDVLF